MLQMDPVRFLAYEKIRQGGARAGAAQKIIIPGVEDSDKRPPSVPMAAAADNLIVGIGGNAVHDDIKESKHKEAANCSTYEQWPVIQMKA